MCEQSESLKFMLRYANDTIMDNLSRSAFHPICLINRMELIAEYQRMFCCESTRITQLVKNAEKVGKDCGNPKHAILPPIDIDLSLFKCAQSTMAAYMYCILPT